MIRSEPAKILIADDEDDTRQFLYDFLEQLGHQVIAVSNGKDALLEATTNFPDVILLDVMMPQMSGLEVCQALKNQETTKDIPIIFVTAKASINDQITGLMIGAQDYINKPYRITELTARLNTALKLKRLQDELKQTKSNLSLLKEKLTQEISEIFIQINKVPKEDFSLDTQQELFNKVTEKINSLLNDL